DFDVASRSVPQFFQLTNAKASGIDALLARPGDILIARVGRNLEDKVTIVERGLVALSDCVLRLQVHAKHQGKVVSFLQSEPGRDALRAASHGVGAKFITVDALLDIKVLGYNE
ncbi:hypothetical protein ACVBEH_21440, partial [Roseateles sp. GG27B]